jgi:hypothetical protein
MNPTATRLLNMTARDVIGSVVKFRSPKTDRIRTGKIRGISAEGVRVVTPTHDPFMLRWEHLLEVIEPEGAKV